MPDEHAAAWSRANTSPGIFGPNAIAAASRKRLSVPRADSTAPRSRCSSAPSVSHGSRPLFALPEDWACALQSCSTASTDRSWRRDRQAADERGCRKNRRPCKASDLTWPPARMSGCRRELLRTPGRRFLAPLRFRSRDPGHLWASFLQDGDPGSHETLAGLARDGVHMRSDTRSVSSPRARRVNVVLFGQRKAPRRAVVMSAPLWLRSRRVLLCSPR